jgi:acetyltransferase-like isoleucine patch superfamily enzyme
MRLKWRVNTAKRDALSRAVHWGWREFQQAGVVTADTPAGRAFARFGRGSIMAFPPGSVFGENGIAVGADTLIGQLVTISAGTVPGQDLCGMTLLAIGDRCVIGRGSHIVAHQSVTIGDDVWTGPYVYITDQNHGYEDPGVPIGSQFPVNRPVSIGAGSWLGAGAIILPGATIGRNVVVAAGAVVRGVVPDQCVVAGVPAKIVREHTKAGWQPARAASRKLDLRLPPQAMQPGAAFCRVWAGLIRSRFLRSAPTRSDIGGSPPREITERGAERGDGAVQPREAVGQRRVGQRAGSKRRGQPGKPRGGLLDRGQQGRQVGDHAELPFLQVQVDEDRDLRPQHPGIERLGDVVHGARRVPAEGKLGVRARRGQEDDRHVRLAAVPLDLPGRLEAVHAGHDDVKQDDRELVRERSLDGGLTGPDEDEFLVQRRQDRLEREQVLRAIIDEQDLRLVGDRRARHVSNPGRGH